LIEIGKERTIARGTRKASRFFDFIGGILVVVWLVRGYLGVSQYTVTLLAVAFGLGLLADTLKTDDRGLGALRGVSSFLGHVAWWCLFTIVLIFFLGWVAGLQSDPLPSIFNSYVPDLAIAMVVFGLASLAFHQGTPSTKRLRASEPALLVRQASTIDMGQTKIMTKTDCIGLPVQKSTKTVGCVVTGDVKAVFDTPMGTVTAAIPGPVTTFGVPFKGEKATEEESQKIAGKGLRDLVAATKVETSMVGETEIEVDLPPYVHVKRDEFQDSVEFGPVSVRRGPKGEIVKIGPISIDADEQSDKWFSRQYWGKHGRFSPWWSLKGTGDWGYISSSGEGVKARWNGSSLELRPASMKLKVGSDGFSYSPQELETYTPLHTLRVTQDKVTLNTKRFTLDVIGARVILRTEDGSKRTDSTELARDLKTLLADTAKKQVSDVLEGQPIELDEMLRGTEELLKKYG
jgi:hypothetical protein